MREHLNLDRHSTATFAPLHQEDKDKEVWRQKFLDYYATNAPEKVEMVIGAMMDKWEGKYEKLFTGMKSKYKEPGHPIVPAPEPKTKPKPKGTGAGGRLTLEDCLSPMISSTPSKLSLGT